MQQREISLEKNEAKVGQVMRVLFDRKEGEYFVGRTEHDSPEVDNEVLVSGAYNAGPHRVDQWTANMKREIPLDAWIETIRFNETRQYVQNIMSFGLIKRALNILKQDLAHSKNASLVEFNFMVGSEATVKPRK